MMADQNTSQLESGLVYNYIKTGLNGEDIPGKTLSFETPEFAIISQKEITQTLVHIFGAKIKRTSGKRMLIFDTDKLDRLGKIYDLDIEIKVLEESIVPDVGSVKDTHLNTNNERENTSEDPVHPAQATLATQRKVLEDDNKAARLREYERLSARARKRSKEAAKGEGQ
jgi:hypothetical protein